MVGFVLVDKPAGPTSHDIVAITRKALDVRRVGHAGTLDPPATGLLVVAVGPATRLVRFVQALPKTYEVRGVLGVRTSTLDAAGEVTSREPVTAGEPDIRAAAARFVGRIEQIPPAVSAVKVGGQRAYKRAARGEDVRLEPRPVTVYELEITAVDGPSFEALVRCSSGTYVRSLVAGIGDVLGCGAHVATLRRTAIGSLHVDDAVAPAGIDPNRVATVESTLRDLPRVDVDADTAARARNGRPFESDARGEVLVVGPSGAVGVFEAGEGILRPVTVIGAA